MQTLKVWAVSTQVGNSRRPCELIAMQRGGTLEALIKRLQKDDPAWWQLKESGTKAKQLTVTRGAWQSLLKRKPHTFYSHTPKWPRVYLVVAKNAPDWVKRITYPPFTNQQLNQES